MPIKTKLRILVVSRMYPHPDMPCNGPFVHEQVKALRQKGMDVRVISGRAFPLFLKRPWGVKRRWRHFRHAWDHLDWTEYDGVPVVYVPYHVGWTARLLGLDDPYRDAVFHAGCWARGTFDFDLIHAHTAYPDGFAALFLATTFSRPFVITEHTGPFSILTRRRDLRYKTISALCRAERIWCVSDSLTREVAAYLPADVRCRVQTLYNGVDTERFRPPVDWRPNPDAPRLAFVGLFEPVKNLPVLIDAFARLRRRLPKATLSLVGEGPLYPSIQKQITRLRLDSAVRLLGRLDREQTARFLREECDVLVLPSRSETFGVVLIEALASGKPVVASRCGGPESIVTDPRLGTLCQPNDVRALYHCLLQTIARLPEFDRDAIRNYAVEKFDYDVLASSLIEQYQVIARPTAFPANLRAA
ncbi:MAG: hypothetical protein KatS3mg105_0199 [Gemmatales bacterium]|nr:MAG: hypothetical protein KatS3mg105_0199 [Gemmatales bacterium]